MKQVGIRARAAVLLRSFLIQASWNYRTLLGLGFAFVLLPLLRRIYERDPEGLAEALRRHDGLFNAHPYLAPVALGAVGAMELEGEDPAIIERFKMALRGSLGTLGDRLIWAGWRPVCLLFALVLLLAGAAWWVAVLLFLVVYNAGQIGLRIWGFRLGWREGKRVGERLRRSRIGELQPLLSGVGAFLVGMLLPLAATGGLVGVTPPPLWIGLAAAAAVLGVRHGAAIRTPLIVALVAVAASGLIMGVLS